MGVEPRPLSFQSYQYEDTNNHQFPCTTYALTGIIGKLSHIESIHAKIGHELREILECPSTWSSAFTSTQILALGFRIWHEPFVPAQFFSTLSIKVHNISTCDQFQMRSGGQSHASSMYTNV